MNNILTSLQLNNDTKHQVYINQKDIKNYGYIYLYNTNTEEQITLDLVPTSIAESYKPSITSVSPFGTIRPYYFYGGGDSKTISFSIDLHEDLDNIDGSINKLMDRIKKLSMPIHATGALKEPIVYMQLGTQFAGTGHVNISFNYKKPYDITTGRFKVVNMSITFTYHEVYDKLKSEGMFTVDYKNYDSTAQEFANQITSFNKNIKNKHLENLLGLGVDYQVLGNYIFNNEKIKKVFNIALQSVQSIGDEKKDTLESRKQIELEAIRSALTSGHSVSTNEIVEANVLKYTYNPHAMALYNLYIELVVILNPNYIIRVGELKALEELDQLLKELDKTKKEFLVPRDSFVLNINDNLDTITIYKEPFIAKGSGSYYLTQDYETYVHPDKQPTYIVPFGKFEQKYIDFVTANNLYIDTDGNTQYTLEQKYFQEATKLLAELKASVRATYNSSSVYGWYKIRDAIYMTGVTESAEIRENFDLLKDLVQLQINTRTMLYGMGG